MHEENNPGPATIEPQPAHQSQTSDEPVLWVKYSFSRDWFLDAVSESTSPSHWKLRRREIIFAVCFAESYLLEWVRDEILKQNFEKLFDYFPVDERIGIIDRWKNVIKRLAEDGLIEKSPDFGQPYWEEFKKLVDFRNGLIHANISKPHSAALKQKERPYPTAEMLEKLEPGWPTNTVRELVIQLHKAVGTDSPTWLQST
jgi:hypothetical protein